MKTKFVLLSLAATVSMANFTSCIEDEDLDQVSKQILDEKKKAELVKTQAEQGKNLYSIYLNKLEAEEDYQNAQVELLDAQQNYDLAVANAAADIDTSKRLYTQWLETAQYNVSIYEKKVELYNKAIADYEAAGTTGKIDKLNDEIAELQAQLDAVNVERAEYKAAIENQNTEYSSQIRSLQARLNTLGDENGNTTYPNDEKLNALQAKLYELRAQKESVEAEYDEWKQTELSLSFAVSDYSVIENAPLFYYSNGFSREGNSIYGEFTNAQIVSNTWAYSSNYRNWKEYVSDGDYISLGCYVYDWNSRIAMFEAFYKTLQNITGEYSSYKTDLKAQYQMLKGLEDDFTELYESKTATRDEYEESISDLQDEIEDYEQQKSDYIDDIRKQINILYGMMPSTTKAELENKHDELYVMISGKKDILNVYKGIQNTYYNYEDGLEQLNSQLQGAKQSLVSYQNNVTDYQSTLSKIENGLWSQSQTVEDLKLMLENAKEAVETAKTNYDYYQQLYKSTLATVSQSLEA